MTTAIANVSVTTDTFQAWITKTNQLAYAMSTEVVTANSSLATTTGNTYIDGRLSANTLIAAGTLRGGNNSTANVLIISSNAQVNAHLSVANTLTVTNTATFGVVVIDKITANGALGTGNNIMKSNSTGGIFWGTGGEGYTGSKGDIGFTGSAGTSGTSGVDGYTGSRGATGFTGSAGTDGTNGTNGYTGSSGLGYTGSVGFTGSASTAVGPLGYTGSRGFTGSAGTNGATGYTGSAFSSSSSAQISSLGVGTAASGTVGEIRATNNITAYYSDMRLKTKLRNISGALEKVLSLNGFYFRPNEEAKRMGYEDVIEVGVAAQEVQNVLPEIVVPAPIDDKYLTVRYEKLIPLLIEAIKELNEKISN